MEAERVGKGVQNCSKGAIVPICLANGATGMYSIVPNMRINRMLLDALNCRVYAVGEGDHEIKLNTGSYAAPTSDLPNGHMMLLVCCWDQTKSGPTRSLHPHASSSAKQVTVEDHDEESPDERLIVAGWE